MLDTFDYDFEKVSHIPHNMIQVMHLLYQKVVQHQWSTDGANWADCEQTTVWSEFFHYRLIKKPREVGDPVEVVFVSPKE